MAYVCGLDIGYGNVKIVHGKVGGKAKVMVAPANAGPASRISYDVIAKGDIPLVLVNDEMWVWGVEAGVLQQWEKELHKDYTSTDTYKALFYGALGSLDTDVVDVLVTGLPVSEFKKDEVRNNLVKQMQGEHKIAEKRKVTVKKVLVLPQPAGAYMDLVKTYKDTDLLDKGRVTVIDSGFFSVDYVSIEGGSIRDMSAGSSLKAMSRLIAAVNDLIVREHGAMPGVARIENALRSSEGYVYAAGRKVELAPYIGKAESDVCNEALVSVKKDMRDEGTDSDILLMAGGGAKNYVEAAKNVFKNCANVVMSNDPHLANARGFFEYARVSA